VRSLDEVLLLLLVVVVEEEAGEGEGGLGGPRDMDA